MAALPAAGISLFGIGAANPEVLARYQSQIDAPTSYFDALYRLIVGEFGKTLDGATVSPVLGRALVGSGPLIVLSLLVIAASLCLVIARPRPIAGPLSRAAFSFVSFLPAFLPGFVVLAIAVVTGSSLFFEESTLRVIALALCIAIPPSCLAVSMALQAYEIEAERRYVLFMRACGHGESDIHKGMRRAILLYVLPGWEKLVSLQIAVLIFTEAIFSYPGFGSLFLHSVQRTDLNVILASVTCIATLIVSLRCVREVAVAWLEPPTRRSSAA